MAAENVSENNNLSELYENLIVIGELWPILSDRTFQRLLICLLTYRLRSKSYEQKILS